MQQQFHTPVQSPIVKLQQDTGSHTALTNLANSGGMHRRPGSAGASDRTGSQLSGHSSSNMHRHTARPNTARPGQTKSVGASSVASSSTARKRKATVEAVMLAAHHNTSNTSSISNRGGGSGYNKQQQQQQQQIIARHGGHIVATSPLHGLIQTPLDVEDVEMSVRLMQCLDNLKRPQNGDHSHVEKRFTGELRTTTQSTRDEHWARRMESVKQMRAKQQAELHKKTQMHQLFKHYAFEQRMASRSNTPSVAAAAAAAISGTSTSGDGASNGSAATATTLFPTTTNSLTRQQMEEYFAVPSFVRPLLSTFKRPDASSGGNTYSATSSMMGARSVSVSTTGAGGGGGGGAGPMMMMGGGGGGGGGSRSSSAYDPAGFAEHVVEQIDSSQQSAQISQSEESFRRARAALQNQQAPPMVSRGNRGFK